MSCTSLCSAFSPSILLVSLALCASRSDTFNFKFANSKSKVLPSTILFSNSSETSRAFSWSTIFLLFSNVWCASINGLVSFFSLNASTSTSSRILLTKPAAVSLACPVINRCSSCFAIRSLYSRTILGSSLPSSKKKFSFFLWPAAVFSSLIISKMSMYVPAADLTNSFGLGIGLPPLAGRTSNRFLSLSSLIYIVATYSSPSLCMNLRLALPSSLPLVTMPSVGGNLPISIKMTFITVDLPISFLPIKNIEWPSISNLKSWSFRTLLTSSNNN